MPLDLRIAWRRLAKSPGFSIVSVLVLGLGIGVSTAVFTLGSRILLDSLPYREPHRLVHLFETTKEGRREASYPDFLIWKESPAFESVAGYTVWTMPLRAGEHLQPVDVAAVTPGFFETLGVGVASGRGFTRADEAPGAPPVALVSQALHTRLFGAAPEATGQTLRGLPRPVPEVARAPGGHTLDLGGRACTVIGVLPSRFQLAPAGAPQVWMPLPLSENRRTRGYWHWLNVVGRLAPGETLDSARAALAATARTVAASDPARHGETGVTATQLRDEVVGAARPVLWPLALTAAAVLLLACANTGVGLLARGLARAHELSVRQALGAGRGRMLRELLAESLVLGALAALAGAGAAAFLIPLLSEALPRVAGVRLPYLDGLALDGRALGFALSAALATSAVAGLIPALLATRQAPSDGLRAGGRALTSGGAGLRFGLVAAQAALTTVLLAGTGLLVRSTVALLSVDAGFSPGGLLTLRIQLPQRLPPAALGPLHDRLLAELQSLPGAAGAATVSKLPLSGGGDTGTAKVEGADTPELEAHLRTVSPAYFPVLGLPLREGRVFGAEDRADTEPVVVVNARLSRLLLGGASPVGRRLTFPFLERPVTVVGVVADENVTSLDQPLTPVVYFPSAQDASRDFFAVVKTPDGTGIAAAAEARLRSLDGDLVVSEVSTMARRLAESPAVAPRRTVAVLMGLFAALALILSGIGVAHVLAWETARRTREIGVRLALGARPAQIAGLFAAQGLAPLACGLLLGLLAALATARLLATFLYGIGPADPLSHALAVAALGAAGLVACAVPAARAARLDPAAALRAE